jgi:hypothetical protein
MARKPATRAEFALFDVFYEDGSRRSNRRVPSELLGGIDGDAPARAVIEEQDRLICQKVRQPRLDSQERPPIRCQIQAGSAT